MRRLVPARIYACVAPYRFLELLLVTARNVDGIVERHKAGIPLLQVERFDEAPESEPVDVVFCREECP